METNVSQTFVGLIMLLMLSSVSVFIEGMIRLTNKKKTRKEGMKKERKLPPTKKDKPFLVERSAP